MTGSPANLVSFPEFEGTLEELSRLASDGKLAVEDVPLARVAEQLADHITTTPGVDLDAVGETFLIAASLLVLKSSRVIAQPEQLEEMEPERDRKRDEGLTSLSAWLGQRHGRESLPPLAPSITVARRLQPRTSAELSRAWNGMVSRERDAARPVRVPTFARIEVAISRLIRALQGQRRLSLGQMLRKGTRNDAVLHFLAVLELVRGGRARVVQKQPFDDMIVEVGEDGGSRSQRAG